MKEFLINKFGQVKGKEIYKSTDEKSLELYKELLVKKENEQLALRNIILPVVALYELLLSSSYKDEALSLIKEYMNNWFPLKTIKFLKKIERGPFTNMRFKRTLNDLAHSGNLTCVLDIIENGYLLTIEESLWNEVVVNAHHPELKDLYYISLDIIFSHLTKYTYKRTMLNLNKCEIKFIKK